MPQLRLSLREWIALAFAAAVAWATTTAAIHQKVDREEFRDHVSVDALQDSTLYGEMRVIRILVCRLQPAPTDTYCVGVPRE